jgi:predicted nucleic acid-binding protein
LTIYLDTSVIVSLFVPDRFTAIADTMLKREQAVVAVSDFAAAEFASAISLRVRTAAMKAAEALVTFSDFDAWISTAVEHVSVDSADIRIASTALRRLDLPLKAPDAVHIGIALRLGAVLATFDDQMIESASALGLKVISR